MAGLWTVINTFHADRRGGDAVIKRDRGNVPATLPPGTIPWKLQINRWWSDDWSFCMRITDVVEGPASGNLICEFLGTRPPRFFYNKTLNASLHMTRELREDVQKRVNRDSRMWD